MASPRKRPSPPLDADPGTAVNIKTEDSSEPPGKKLCKSLDSDRHPSSELAGGSSPAWLKTEGSCDFTRKKLCQPQVSHGHPSSGSKSSHTAEESSAASAAADDDDFSPDELEALEKLSASPTPTPATADASGAHDDGLNSAEFDSVEEQLKASPHSQATPTPAAAGASDVDDGGLSPDEFRSREEQLEASQHDEATPTPADADVVKVHEDLRLDDFESLDELVAASRNSQSTLAPERRVNTQPGPVSSAATDIVKLETDTTQNRHAAIATMRRVTASRPTPVSYTEADLETPKIDAGEESDDSGVIDLTRDVEIEVGRSDGFIGTIKPGIPGITVKRKGAFEPTMTPTRRPLAQISTNKPSPRKWDNRKSIHPGLTTPSASSTGKQEDQGTPAQDCKPALAKFEDGDKKLGRRKGPAVGSPEITRSQLFDMAKFLVNEQNLAAMPFATQPPQLKTKLLDHQRQALRWMIGMEQPHDTYSGPSARLAQFWGRKPRYNTDPDSDLDADADLDADSDLDADADALANPSVTPFSGGILADDMGLGKTLEMIALIMREPKGAPTLIVAPKGVLSNWESQIRRHIRWDYAPKMLRYHGSRGHLTPNEIERYDIVVTTYQKVADEVYGKGTLRRVQWRRVILDEGHTIRNPDSLAARAGCKLQAKSYWVCTGTPIINSVNDIYSLGRFIGITKTLRKSPSDIIRRLKHDHQFLQDAMTTICLRRTKEMSFINLNLPPKQEEVFRIQFSETEDAMYQQLLVDARKAAAMFFRTRHYELWTHLLERLLRLRQMCNHWTLCKKKGMDNCREALDKLLREAGGSPNDSQRDELLHLSLEAKIACGICKEPLSLESRPVITPCVHVFCKACIVQPSRDTAWCPTCPDSTDTFSTTSIIELGSVPGSAYEVPNQHDHSSKTKALMGIIEERLRNKGSKIVIFSQWTSFLDLVAHHLEVEDIGHERIDGTMSTTLRDDAVRALDNDPSVRVMLASLRAAGVGISLVAADTAILTDSWWAPAIEEQAVDRVHRLGQERPTKVYRLVIEGAVEETVIRIQDRKRELVGTAFQEEFKALSKVSFTDMVQEILR